MKKIVLDQNVYRDKVYACWLGKNIGGTLGAPDECKKYPLTLSFYDPLPDKSAPNDDLDLQLIWLFMLEKEGLPPRLPNFGRYWKEYLHKYPWNEYGFCNRNLQRGLTPPVSGWFENYYVDEMGSPIRSELWACVAPADPQTAASLAWMDAAMDHAGGEGMYGEMFWAAVESAAFDITAPTREHSETLRVTVTADGQFYSGDFVVLAPQEAQGYPNAVQSTIWSPGMNFKCSSPRYPSIQFFS